MHEGHRQRMYSKLTENDKLYDHELLEILLYNIIRRQNTNPLAHRLMDKFSSISNIFKASVEELVSVEGVGEQVAYYLLNIGKSLNHIQNRSYFSCFRTVGVFFNFALSRLESYQCNRIEFYFLNKYNEVIRITSTTQDTPQENLYSTDDLIRDMVYIEPYTLAIARTHLGSSKPFCSAEDIAFIKRCLEICNFYGVQFLDYAICCCQTGMVYSFYEHGKLNNKLR